MYSRLAFVLFALFLVMAGFLFWFFEQASLSTQNETSQRLYLNLAENIVNDLGVIKNNQFDLERIQEAFQAIMVIGPSIELYILDRKGQIVTLGIPQEKVQRLQINLQPIIDFIQHQQALPILGDDPRSLERQKIFSASAVYEENNSIGNQKADKTLIGYVYIIIGGENYDSIATALRLSNTWRISLLGIALALSFLLLVSLLLFYVLTRPLRQLTNEIKAFEQADFKKNTLLRNQINKEQRGEITQLRESFYQMQQRIIEQLARLKKQDEIRREFLAHVSHDLRTPLAGMQVYLETLVLKQNDLSLTQQQQFLQKAMTNGHRLEGMINELFELTRLESHQIKWQAEEFLMSDLLSDIFATLESKAQQHSISLQIDFQQANKQVYADIAKVERVIQNLTENAIRYSHANATVMISATTKNNYLCLSIRDQGCGIHPKDLPFIFEPYFRASDEYKLKHKGAGLGLAISQRLLALHNISLNVSSEINKGTVFSFCLQKV